MKFFSHALVCSFILVSLLQSSISPAYGSFWNTQKYKKQIKETFVGQKIEIIPLENKIRMGFGKFSLGDFHYVKTLDKVFFQDNSIHVEIQEIDFENETISVKVFHPKYGFGKIIFFFNEEQYKKTDVNKLKEVFNSSLSDVSLNQVVVNTETGRYHLPSCNHLPSTNFARVVSREQAKQSGNKPCGFCFKHFIYIPNYQLEQSMARKMSANLRYYSPVTNNNADQLALFNAGKKVLNSWPIELLGYDYSFTLVEDPNVNAFSLPGGQVFVTTGLYRSLENPLELEAVLAHEIAHVERRHSLKSFKAQQELMRTQQAMAAIGGAAAGMAASRNNYGAATSALAISITMMALAEATNGGYSKKHEREADLFATLYFEQNSLDKKWLAKVFKKLQFVNLCNVADPDPDSDTHPQLRERFNAVNNTTFRMLKGDNLYCQKKKFSNLYIDPMFLSEYSDEMTLYLYIDNNDFVAKKMYGFGISTSLSVKVGKKNIIFKCDKKDTVFTEFGAVLTFRFNNKKNLKIENFSAAELKIADENSDTYANYESYKFLPYDE